VENCFRTLVRVGEPRSAGSWVAGGGWIAGDRAEDVGPVGGPQFGPDLVGLAVERGLAAGGQQQHLVADIEIGQRVGDDEHHAAGVGQLAQHRHHLAVQGGVKA